MLNKERSWFIIKVYLNMFYTINTLYTIRTVMGYPETSGSGKNPELTQITKCLNPQRFTEVNKKG